MDDIEAEVAKVEAKMDELKARLVALTRLKNGRLLGFPDEILARYDYMLQRWNDPPRTDDHPTTSLLCPFNNMYIPIDTMIAPLIVEIWKAGWKTDLSCQDNYPKGYIWIDFRYSHHLEKFLNVILKGEMEDISVADNCFSFEYVPNSWKFKFHNYPHFASHTHEESSFDSDASIEAEPIKRVSTSVALRFPQTDLSFVYDKLVKHNQ